MAQDAPFDLPRRRRGRPRTRLAKGNTGGKNDIPRSLGSTLEAVRMVTGLDQDAFANLLEATPSEFLLPQPRRRKAGREEGGAGPRISNWERGAENVSFAYQHRYSILARSLTGLLHLTSLLYAQVRDANAVGVATEARDAKLQFALEVADGITSFGQGARAVLEEIVSASDLQGDPDLDDDLRLRHLALINRLLDGYRLDFPKTPE